MSLPNRALKYLLLIFACVTLDFVNGSAPACKSWNDVSVDWFIAYKLPRNIINGNNDINLGLSVMYADSLSDQMTLKHDTIDGHTNAIAYTIKRAYETKNKQPQNRDEMYAFYSDQPPFGTDPQPNFAHAKGVLNFDKERGFWMMHTVPRFPDTRRTNYRYADNGDVNGQIFFCATFHSHQLGEIAAQLYTSRFFYYEKFIPQAMQQKWPFLYPATRGLYNMNNAPFWRYTKLRTFQNTWIDNFQKYGNANADPYANIIAESLKLNFHVQTFPGPSANEYQSACDHRRFGVKNIKRIQYVHPVHGGGQLTMRWDNTKDHSKWAVSQQNQYGYFKPVVCVGDINRQETQRVRGGGAMCLTNLNVWTFFNGIVNRLECCESEAGQHCDAASPTSELTPEHPINYHEA